MRQIVITIAANIGDVGILGFDCAFPDSIIGITPIEGVLPHFLPYYLETQKRERNLVCTGSSNEKM